MDAHLKCKSCYYTILSSLGHFRNWHSYTSFSYQLMAQCWNTMADERPKFADIVERLAVLIENPTVSNQPIPPILHRLHHQKSGGSHSSDTQNTQRLASVGSTGESTLHLTGLGERPLFNPVMSSSMISDGELSVQSSQQQRQGLRRMSLSGGFEDSPGGLGNGSYDGGPGHYGLMMDQMPTKGDALSKSISIKVSQDFLQLSQVLA